jgi:hypothetical protein
MQSNYIDNEKGFKMKDSEFLQLLQRKPITIRAALDVVGIDPGIALIQLTMGERIVTIGRHHHDSVTAVIRWGIDKLADCDAEEI